MSFTNNNKNKNCIVCLFCDLNVMATALSKESKVSMIRMRENEKNKDEVQEDGYEENR